MPTNFGKKTVGKSFDKKNSIRILYQDQENCQFLWMKATPKQNTEIIKNIELNNCLICCATQYGIINQEKLMSTLKKETKEQFRASREPAYSRRRSLFVLSTRLVVLHRLIQKIQ